MTYDYAMLFCFKGSVYVNRYLLDTSLSKVFDTVWEYSKTLKISEKFNECSMNSGKNHVLLVEKNCANCAFFALPYRFALKSFKISWK